MNVHVAMSSGIALGVIGVEECLGGAKALAGVGRRGSWTPEFGNKLRSSAIVSSARFRELRGWVRIGQHLELKCSGLERFSRKRTYQLPALLCGQTERLSGTRSSNAQNSSRFSRCFLQLKFLKRSDFGFSRKRGATVYRRVGVAPVEESRPDAEDEVTTDHMQESIAALSGHNSWEKPQRLNTIPEEVVSQIGGKAGSISFYSRRSESELTEEAPSLPNRELRSLVWLLGPLTLVASVVLPPLYLRRIFGAVLEDSLVTDFFILFFTETLFFAGAAVFLYIAHISRLATATSASLLEHKPVFPVYSLGYRLSAKISLSIGVLLPLASFVFVWPWTGPAAAAALAPYMIGLFVQLAFEHIIRANNSPVWPLVPITFQLYRLHQLNRAAQLVAGLLFSLKGVEATAETMAINGSLQTLLLALQILGIVCLWSLGSFLTNQLPTKLGQQSSPSLP